MIKVFDTRSSFYTDYDLEGQRERERLEQVKQMVSESFLFSCIQKPGEFIRRYGNRYSRLKELKSHHFSYRK